MRLKSILRGLLTVAALLVLSGEAFAGPILDRLRERRGEKSASSCGSCTSSRGTAPKSYTAPAAVAAPRTYSLPTAASGCVNGNCPAQAAKWPTWLR